MRIAKGFEASAVVQRHISRLDQTCRSHERDEDGGEVVHEGSLSKMDWVEQGSWVASQSRSCAAPHRLPPPSPRKNGEKAIVAMWRSFPLRPAMRGEGGGSRMRGQTRPLILSPRRLRQLSADDQQHCRQPVPGQRIAEMVVGRSTWVTPACGQPPGLARRRRR